MRYDLDSTECSDLAICAYCGHDLNESICECWCAYCLGSFQDDCTCSFCIECHGQTAEDCDCD